MSVGVCIFGATGSIGVHTLDVIQRHPQRYHVTALSAYRNVDLLYQQCRQFSPKRVVMVDESAAAELEKRLGNRANIELTSGAEALPALVDATCTKVVCGIVGAAGLLATVAAVEAGKQVLLANKEPLVMLGAILLAKARASGATLLPLDSEHNAIFQCLPQTAAPAAAAARTGAVSLQGVRKLTLTASGGPFWRLPHRAFATLTPAQACAHPNWRMGRKISVDSATMMNKGLELLEACALFEVDQAQVEVLVHPQSVVHSLVEYVDGSVLAQLGSADMRIPIANALAWPERIESGAARLDLVACQRLDFEPPDHARFPAINLARQAAQQAGNRPATLNAANEVAVEAFLNGQTSFDKITEWVALTLQQVPQEPVTELDAVLAADAHARAVCRQLMRQAAG